MRAANIFIPLFALIVLIVSHCNGDTPPNYSGNFDDSASELADSEGISGADTLTYGGDSATSADENTDIETETQTDTAVDTESITGVEIDTESDTAVDSDGQGETDTVTSTLWWDCEYPERREINILGLTQIEAKHALSVIFDHKSLVSGNMSRADGKDIRVLHWNGSSYKELPRVLDPHSDWNRTDTKIWFSPQKGTFSVGDAEKIYLYFGSPSPNSPPDSEDKVFHFADFFDRKNSSNLGNHWEELTTAETDVEIEDNALYFEQANDETNRPVVEGSFDPITTRFSFRFGFDWSLSGDYDYYRLHIQFGKRSKMEHPPGQSEWDWFSNAGVGPSLLWSSPYSGMIHHEGFGYEVAGDVTEIAVISEKAGIQGVVDVAKKTYTLAVAGGPSAYNVPFSSPVDAIDTVRIFTWSFADGSTHTSHFRYFIINKVGAKVPTVTLTLDPSTQDYQDWCF